MQLTYLSTHVSSGAVVVSRAILDADRAEELDVVWAEMRTYLGRSCRIGESEPILPPPADRLRPCTRRRAIAYALSTITHRLPGIETTTAWARTSPLRQATDLAAVVDHVYSSIDAELVVDDARGLVFTTRTAPAPVGHFSRLIESPITKDLATSPGLQAADLVAWTGLHQATVAEIPGFPWQPYDCLKPVDRWGFPLDVDDFIADKTSEVSVAPGCR